MLLNYRCCVSCRKTAPKTDFWRVVRLSSSQTIQLDHGMGRSAYLCPCLECLQFAQKKDRLGRSLKAPVAKELYQALWQRLSSVSETAASGGGFYTPGAEKQKDAKTDTGRDCGKIN